MLYAATMKSMTGALKAEKALNNKGIPCRIVSLDPSLTKKGCSYGVAFSSDCRNTAMSLLDSLHVSYGDVIKWQI